MQEQERIASEEVEKRLKATLTAKREPGTVGSRVASPGVAVAVTPDVKTTSGESETIMDVETTVVASPQKEEVSFFSLFFRPMSTIFILSHTSPEPLGS